MLVKKTQASHSCKCPIYSTISYPLSFLLSLFFSIFLYLSQSLLQLVNELVGSSVSKLIETALPIWVSTRPLANSLSLILSTFPNPISVPPPPFPLTGWNQPPLYSSLLPASVQRGLFVIVKFKVINEISYNKSCWS